MFNAQDLRNLHVFLGRVDLKGNESMAHAELLIKTSNMLQEAENPAPTKTPVPSQKTDKPDGRQPKEKTK